LTDFTQLNFGFLGPQQKYRATTFVLLRFKNYLAQIGNVEDPIFDHCCTTFQIVALHYLEVYIR